MKKLILLLFIPLTSFGQIIVYEKFVELEPSIKAQAADHLISRRKQTKVYYTNQINITELKDEYVEIIINIRRSPRRHLLITSEKKAFPLNFAYGTSVLTVYDGNNIISLTTKIDLINYFTKYGFDYIETNNAVSGSVTDYHSWGWLGYATTNFKNRSSMLFKNNNN